MNWEYERLEDKKEKPKEFREHFPNGWKFNDLPINGITDWGWRIFGYDKNNPKKLKIGFGCDIGCNTVIHAHEGVIINPHVQIGPHCAIISYSTIDNKKGQVVLKRNCRVGAHSTIMPGVTVGENSIIGAYSFVNKDIPDNVVALGIPAKVIKKLK